MYFTACTNTTNVNTGDTHVATVAVEQMTHRPHTHRRSIWKNKCKVTCQHVYAVVSRGDSAGPVKKVKCKWKKTIKNMCKTGEVATAVYLSGVPSFWGEDLVSPKINFSGVFYADSGSMGGVSHSITFDKHGTVTQIWRGHQRVNNLPWYSIDVPQACLSKQLSEKVSKWIQKRRGRQNQKFKGICLMVLLSVFQNRQLCEEIYAFVV